MSWEPIGSSSPPASARPWIRRRPRLGEPWTRRKEQLARPWTLRWRLLALLGVLLLCGLGVSGMVTYRALNSYLVQREDLQLNSFARAAARDLIGTGAFGGYGPRIGFGTGGGEPFVEALNQSRAVVASSPASAGATVLPAPKLPTHLPSWPSTEAATDPVGDAAFLTVPSSGPGQAPYRVRVSPLSSGPLEVPGDTLIVATPLTDVEATLHAMVWTELGVTAGVLILALLAGLWLVRRSLRPLDEMTDTAGEIAAGQLDRRVPVEGDRTEVGRLGLALNGMLGRIEGAFAEKEASEARLRRFVGDASHELRTPLTSIRGYAELFRRGADRRPEDLAKVMHRIEEEATRMGLLVDDLLLLARLDQGRPLEDDQIDLCTLVDDAVDAARVVEPDRAIDTELAGPLLIRGDRNRLRQVIDNLLGNVRMHTPAGAPARVRLFREAGSAVLEVEDSGPGLDPDAAGKVFERFYRADAARTHENGGAGLGLSIVHAIVTAHRGSVSASNRAQGGAVFRVVIPLAPAPAGAGEVEAGIDHSLFRPAEAEKSQEHPSMRPGVPQPSG
ncbi:MAG: sensor histidine kinase [Acidimicrobiales bacterium]